MNIKQKYRNAEISTKITLTYTACFILLLMIINAVMYFGVFYALYRPAARSLKYSMESVENLIETLAQNPHAFNPNSIREPLVAGVVLRAIDDYDNVLVDTDKNYPSNDLFNKNISDAPYLLADNGMDVANIGDALVYRAKSDFTFEGEHVTLYFFRTITSEKLLLDNLENILLILDIVGIVLALAAGNFVSKKTLKPIKIMTEHAKEIAFGKMNERIEITPANDELTELAKTFNDMLDRIQDGIDKQQEFLLRIKDSVDKQQEFVIDASHALINPATAIFGTTEILKKYGFEDKKLFDEMIDSISESVRGMESIIQNLLFIARIDQNRQKLNQAYLNLAYVIQRAVELKQIVSPNHKIEIIQNDDAKIFGDEDMILQMLRKILDNAVKYSPGGKKISVISKVEGNKVFVSISDNGVGIAREHFEKIFERFFRVGTVEDVEGGGLGLTIVRWIAENHGIKIEVASELGRGTTFTLIIPTV